ncbi:hypothetical protein [Arenimonas sp.]|uniref:hypothetical protein n=1 Tax=Arenimonas sp. TaxID=1872635 RepID=UPI002E33CF90|nr:hypothetical protein [Arenimonas sp.]HEX4854375.1 hypothetical protein [Arenimonas sp.]
MLLVGVALVRLNKDALSSSKVLFLFVVVAYAGALLKPSIPVVYFAINALATLCLTSAYIERGKEQLSGQSAVAARSVAIKCWVGSVPAFVATAYLVSSSGGLSGFFETLDQRLLRFEGQGLLLVLVKSAPSIQTAYFALLLTRDKITRLQWIVFAVFTAFAAIAAVVSGSRNTLLVMFLVMAICWSLRSRGGVSLKLGAVGVIVGVLLLVSLEDVRNRAGELARGSSSISELSFADSKSLRYGVIPLEMIDRTEYAPILYGRTFVAAATNFVPRSVWPDKPDGGGEEYTNYYFGTLWAGASRDSPGIFAESVMNFGRAGGFVFAITLLITSYVALAHAYSSLRSGRPYVPAMALVYAYGVVFVGNLPFAEFATAVMNFVTRGLLAAFVAWIFATRFTWNIRR